MRPIEIPALTPEQLAALEELYRTTREARLRTRAQMILLAAEQRMTAAQIAEIVRASEETVRRLISSVTWPKELRACATCRIRAPRAR
jgi:prophage DNA circulation protein